MKDVDEFIPEAAIEVERRIGEKRARLRELDEQIERADEHEEATGAERSAVPGLLHQSAEIVNQIKAMERDTYLLTVAYELRSAAYYRRNKREDPDA